MTWSHAVNCLPHMRGECCLLNWKEKNGGEPSAFILGLAVYLTVVIIRLMSFVSILAGPLCSIIQ